VTWRVERDDLLKDIKTVAKMQGWNVRTMLSRTADGLEWPPPQRRHLCRDPDPQTRTNDELHKLTFLLLASIRLMLRKLCNPT
jgi:hypothetical protein